MKLILSLFFVLAFYGSGIAQMKQISGVYKGKLVNDTTEITITLDLKKDSTYTVSLEFGIYPNYFPTDLTDTCTAEGIWRAKKNIIFFLPDQSKSTSNHNLEQAWYWFGSINALNQAYCDISVSTKEYKFINRYEEEFSYTNWFKMIDENSIIIHMSADVLEEIWVSYPLTKIQ